MEDIRFGVTKRLVDALAENKGEYVLGVNRPNKFGVIEFTLIKDGDKDIVTQWDGKYKLAMGLPIVLEVKEEVFDYTEEK